MRAALVSVLVLAVLTGIAYPLALTGAGQVLFPGAADGSLVRERGRVVGSRLIGQDFAKAPELFQSRPSQTGYDPSATAFSNAGPNQRSLARRLRAAALGYARRERIPLSQVPADAVTTSASGVDPHISVRNARIQARRVARMTGIPLGRVDALVDEHTDGRGLGIFGEPGVNVLELNLAIRREAR